MKVKVVFIAHNNSISETRFTGADPLILVETSNWYHIAEPKKIAGLVSPEHVVLVQDCESGYS